MWLDLKLGFRMLVKYPGLTAVGVLAIAVAVGIGSATFEFVRDILNPKLPLAEGHEIVAIQNWDTAAATSAEGRSLYEFLRWRQDVRSIEHIGAYSTLERNLITSDGRSEPIHIAEISPAAFSLARVAPLFGRPLMEADEQEGAPLVVVIGHALWQSRFGSDPSVIGRTVKLGSVRSVVIGVMPEGFGFPVNHRAWVPLRVNPSAQPRQGASVRIFGRLAAGATLESANAELSALGTRAAAESPATHQHLRPRVVPYTRSFLNDEFVWQAYVIQSLLIMLVVVACANVGTLLYARTATREAEIVVRNALGASRGRIVMQLFLEALVLAAVGAAVGLAATAVLMRDGMAVFWATQGEARPFWWNDSLSPITALYAAGLTVLGALICGVLPAMKATGRRVDQSLRRLAVGGSALRFGGVWTAVIVTQVALSVAFLPMAISEGFEAVRYGDVRAAFEGEHFLTVRLEMDAPARFGVTYEELERRISAEPRVSRVTFGDRLPGMEHSRRQIEIEGIDAPAKRVRVATVDVGLFDTFEARIISGRTFRPEDAASDHAVVVVNEALARDLIGGRNPVGHRIRYPGRAGAAHGRWYEVVGVVSDLGMNPDAGGDTAGLYHPAAPGAVHPAYIAVRVGPNAAAFGQRLHEIAAALDPSLRLYEVLPLNEVARASQMGNKVIALLLGLVAAIALLLSTVGIYSLMSFAVSQRTREIGIRAALGAHPRQIVTAIFSRALAQLGLGVAFGAVGAVALADVEPGQPEAPWILLFVALVMLLVGLASCVVPAMRGLRIDPTEALRQRS